MKKKTNKIKFKPQASEEQEVIRRFFIILAIIIVFLALVFVITKLVKKEKVTKSSTKVEINYNKTIVGNMFNKPYSDYYVVAYAGNDVNALYYSSIIDLYSSKEDSKKVYWLELDNKLNEKYVAKSKDEIDKSVTGLDGLKFGEYTVLRIKDKKIIKYIDNVEDAKKEFNINN